MANRTTIEWTATRHPDGTVTPGATWNPVRGCSRVSPGCQNCYAMGVAHRFSWGDGLTRLRKQTTDERARDAGSRTNRVDWTGYVQLLHEQLKVPLRWRNPRKVFVCSGADLFHPKVPSSFIAEVFTTMEKASKHTFQVLTKRPRSMKQFFDDYPELAGLPNVWLGVSAEDDQRWVERVQHLMQCPAVVRFVSAEPLLGPLLHDVDDVMFRDDEGRCVDWVIVGAESGPGRRPMDEDWVRDIRDDCNLISVPFFYKQRIENGRKVGLPKLDGEVWDEFPEVRRAV